MGAAWAGEARPAVRPVRLTARGVFVFRSVVALLIVCSGGFAEWIGNVLVGPTP